MEHRRARVISAKLLLQCTTQNSHHYHNYALREHDQQKPGGDELYPRVNLGSSASQKQKALRPGTGCPASWTAPPESSEDGSTVGVTQAQFSAELFLRPFNRPSHSPSDMGLPRSTLRWALVRVCACRQIHLYGVLKKSTHNHQTHLPARTHQRHFASSLFPPARPPTMRARQMARKKLG